MRAAQSIQLNTLMDRSFKLLWLCLRFTARTRNSIIADQYIARMARQSLALCYLKGRQTGISKDDRTGATIPRACRRGGNAGLSFWWQVARSKCAGSKSPTLRCHARLRRPHRTHSNRPSGAAPQKQQLGRPQRRLQPPHCIALILVKGTT